MASDIGFGKISPHLGWLVLVIVSAGAAGYCYALDKYPWFVVFLIVIAVSAFLLIKVILGAGKRVRYVLNATLNGDFAYKFPTDNVSKYERESNLALNRIVEHFEHLSSDIRRKETFLAKVINMTDIGMIVTDDDGNVRIHNDSALRLLQRDALTHICQIASQAFTDLSITKHKYSLNGEAIYIYTINDLRHPIQNAEVESWEKLTRVLTHEIMNSLTPVSSIAENMKEKASSAEVQEAFDAISSSSRSLLEFVRNFRKFSVLPEVKMRAVYLKPLLEKCVRMSEEYSPDNNVSIELLCFPPDVMVYTDETLLSRVVINILKNAVEASAGHISLETNILPDEAVEIRISNDGELIAEENAGQIFTPFFTTKASGSGIGLSLSRRIVSHLGGTLTLQSRPHTSFRIKL